MEDEGLETHLRVGNHPREIRIDGKPIVLYRCPLCARDFSREPGESSWRAISVSTFRIAYLPDAVSQAWLAEPCPGRRRQTPAQLPVLEAAKPMAISVTGKPTAIEAAVPTAISLTAEPEANSRRVPGVVRRRSAVRARSSM